MKVRKLTALILTILMLFMMMGSAMADTAFDDAYQPTVDMDGTIYSYNYDYEPTEDYCPYSRTGTHEWSGWYIVREPTCTGTGLERRVCMNDCGWDQTEEIPALGHDYGSWNTVREADCSSEGEMERTCETCGYTQTVYTDKLPHTWGDWKTTQEAGDYSAGQRTRTCIVCGETESQRFYPDGTLKRGDRGEPVKELQENLNKAGHDCGTADGIFGGKTEAAVKQFEEINGLTADGIAWPKLIQHLKNKNKPVSNANLGLKLSGGQVKREGAGFSEIILMEMSLENTGEVPLSVSITSDSWSGNPVSEAFPGWPDGTPELQPGEVFTFQYQISLTEYDLEAGYIRRIVNVTGYDKEHDLYTGDSFMAALPVYGEADTGRIQLSKVNVLREGAGEDTEITLQLVVEDLGKTDMDVWVRSSDSAGEVPSGDVFTDWPENGQGSVFLTPGDSKTFSYVVKPSAKDVQEGRITRKVTAEGVDPVSGQGFVSHVDLSCELLGTDPVAILHVNYHGGPGHDEDHVYQADELLHLDYTVNNYSNVELYNARLLYEVLSADGSCLYKDMSFTGEYGDVLDAPMFGGMLLYTITKEAAENGPLTVLCWAEADRADAPGEIVRSENTWCTKILTGEAPADETDGEESGKWKSRIYVSAEAEDRVYKENETVDIAITIKNAGEEPVNYLNGQIQVMDAPDFTGNIELESEAMVYEDPSTELAPEDSVTVNMTHVVTKEEAERGKIYLAARAEGSSTGVGAYCADTAALTLSASAEGSSGESETPEGGEKEESKKWKSRIYVSAEAEDRVYKENETVDIAITIRNAGEEPVVNLNGQVYVMDAPDFTGNIELESEAPVYEDLSTELAPEDSVTVNMTHVVTKEEAERGKIYLAGRAEGKSTGVKAYCADTAALTLSASAEGSSGESETPEGGEKEESKKWKSRIYVSAEAEDRVYKENETIDIAITIKNAGEEPVVNLNGQVYVMDAPDFTGDIELESEALVYEDPSTELAPEDSVTVNMTHVVTKEEAERGKIYLAARAEGSSTGVGAYCADTAALTLSASAEGSSGESETPEGGEKEESKKWKSRIYVSAEAEDRVYKENETVDIAITIRNAGEEPVVNLNGQIHVMDAPDFTGNIELESEAQVYEDLSTELAPEDSVTVNMTHVVTKEEAERGKIYLAARAEGKSTGVKAYCADTAALTLNAATEGPSEGSETSTAEASLEIRIDPETDYFIPRVPVNYEVTVRNTGDVTINDIVPYDPDEEKDYPGFSAFSLIPGQVYNFSESVTIPLEEEDTPHDYGWYFAGNDEKNNEQITGQCEFTLVPAGMLGREGSGLRIRAEAEEKIYSKGETAVLKMYLENMADESVEDVRLILRRADPDDHSKTTDCTSLSIADLTVQPKGEYTYNWEYVITDSDVNDGLAPLICYVAGRNTVTGQVIYSYFSYDLFTKQP